LVDNRKGADIVIGSRYIKGGKIIGWPMKRKIISKIATISARFFFNLPVKDPLSGFALYKKDKFMLLEGRLKPLGYKLLLEVLIKSPGSTNIEIPITFINRSSGRSKLKFDEILKFIQLCINLKKYENK
jgi:dolichol-phosphate mannosyltransferase